MSTYLVPILIILVLVVVNGVFVAAEFSLLAARVSRLESLAKEGNAAARALTQVMSSAQNKDRYIAVAQLGITLASIGLGMYGEHELAGWLYAPFERLGLGEGAAHSAGAVISLLAITFMHIVFGEMIPKGLALQLPESTSLSVSPLMRLFAVIFAPLVWLLSGMAVGLMRLLGIRDPGENSFLYSSRELAIVTRESAEGGQIDDAQQNLIQNIFALEDHTAAELMTPRTRLKALSISASAEAIHTLIAEAPRSRFPVYEESLDNIVGVLHIKDFIRARSLLGNKAGAGAGFNLRRLLRKLPSVAESETAEDLLALFKRERVHAALVVDEYGGTLGFVTMDDLIEDVIELDEDDPRIIHNPDGSYSLDGEVTLSELRDDLGFKLVSDDANTVAGLVLAAYGTLPPAGITVHVQNVDLTAEAVEGLRITRVRLRQVDGV
ncbi:HlyC/CorC family transporter [Deinococcus detaillensis]|uniref:HlyC/CorC family transporter n=1 Tax=Deinococcus detaillensis TaxID=2592048 RepID=A0A553UGQ0_9DEIO|nr:hemolysin family protein [Deinococcus detaillensis]TSA79393.1 HlyC/CorC family transporter [Deinococcus detaillensis]